MKFNTDILKQMFGGLKSNADDFASAGFKDLGSKQFADLTNDMLTHVSFDDIADTYSWRQTHDLSKPPVTPKEFIDNYKANMQSSYENRELNRMFPYSDNDGTLINEIRPDPTDLDVPSTNGSFDSTPDYSALDIRPEYFGQHPELINSVDFPDGFTDPENYARYYDALEQGVITHDLRTQPQDIVPSNFKTSLIDFNNALPQDFQRKTLPLEALYQKLRY